MAVIAREFYGSSNGDSWSLVRGPAGEELFVMHQANLPSGGQTTRIGIGEFLARGSHGAEQQALLRLIGALVENG
jgi:hypothetical protein